MSYIERDVTLSINGKTAKFDDMVYIFKGDRDIQLNIKIIDTKMKFSRTNVLGNVLTPLPKGCYARVGLIKPKGGPPVIRDRIAIEDDKVKFLIDSTVCDELDEVGIHKIQIQIYALDDDASPRWTLPSAAELEVCKPDVDFDGITPIVGSAKAGLSLMTVEGDTTIVDFNPDGTYNKTTWSSGDVITVANLNKIENAIKKNTDDINNNSTQIKEMENEVGTETLPTTSQTLKGSISELFQNVSNGKQLIATAITDKGVNTSSDATFQVMATNIRNINSSTSYTIINTLTNCNNNNNSTIIEKNKLYNATITPNTGYHIDNLILTMNGEDVTNTFVSGNTINIIDVTGDLRITAIASQIPITTLSYNFDNAIPGNGAGNITLGIEDENDVGSYTIKYADDTGILSNYADICVLNPTIQNIAIYNSFIKDQAIPKYATKIVAVKNSEVKAEFTIPLNKRFSSGNYGTHLYSFGAISDVHLITDTSIVDLQSALTYFNTKESAVFTCISGDVTDGGTESQLTQFKNSVSIHSPNTPVYATNGNHEKYNASFNGALWEKYVGNSMDYIFIHENDVFIMLGIQSSGGASNVFTAEQKSWFEALITKYRGCRIYVFTHCFINGTDNGNFNNYYSVNILTKTNADGSWLLNILKQNTNVFLFTGHSHMKFVTQELNAKVNICNETDSVATGYMVHLPSITCPREIVNSVFSDKLYAQSEGVVIDVYENCVLYRGRNFIDEKFIPIGQYILPVSQGSLPTIVDYTITNNLTNVTTNNNKQTIEEGSSYSATLTANKGYELGNVTVIMNDVDITSTAVVNGVINIPNVIGNIKITATGVSVMVTIPTTYFEKVKLDKFTGAETASINYTASDFIAYNPNQAYRLTHDGIDLPTNWNVSINYYDADGNGIAYSANIIGITSGLLTIDIPVQSLAKYIRIRIYDEFYNVDNHLTLQSSSNISIGCTGLTLSSESLVFDTDTIAKTINITTTPIDTTDIISCEVDANGIVDINYSGSVLTVTPKANGSFIITITCGAITKTVNGTISSYEQGSIPEGYTRLTSDNFKHRTATTTVEQVDSNTINVIFTAGNGKWWVGEGLLGAAVGTASIYVSEVVYSQELTDTLKAGVGFIKADNKYSILNADEYPIKNTGTNYGLEFNLSNTKYIAIGGTLPLTVTLKNLAIKRI